MQYKDYKKALKAIEKKYDSEINKLQSDIDDVRLLRDKRQISDKEAWDREMKLAEILDQVKNKGKRSIERLKMNFVRQNAPAKIGDIIWTTSKVMRVTDVRLAAFEYPMIKYFGLQLTTRGIPCKVQKEYPLGGIYQKDIISVNGEPYIYKQQD